MKPTTKDQQTRESVTANLKREILELTALYKISKAMNSSLELDAVLQEIMRILHEKMGMERGTMTLLDVQSGELTTEIAYGLDKEAIGKGRYRIGEGITGKVVESGEPIVVPNVGKEPLFLNRTGARDLKRSNISFICVPIKQGRKTVGTLSVDRLFQDNISFEEDVRLLMIIGSMVGQALHIRQMYEKEKRELTNENIQLKRELQKKFHPSNIIGESKRMADVFESIQKVCQSRASVIIRGESGTGKELVAHAIHYGSDRSKGPFIKISCAALPETLLESELFGYEKGAFTGATASKAGRFEMAHGGTLFLDEIGDISPSTQVKLLRVLQEKEFERLGGTHTLRVDIRLITATNRDLEKEVREGKFREDLYYRLNVIPVFMPPLRERIEDIPLLVNHFLQKANQENGKKVKFVSDEAVDQLMHYSWPGNVRELENMVERAVVLCQGNTLTPDLFPAVTSIKHTPAPIITGPFSQSETANENGNLTDAVEKLEKKMIQETLRQTGGNQRKAAKQLGVTERIFGYKLAKYGLK